MSKHFECDYCGADCTEGRLLVTIEDATVDADDNECVIRDMCEECATERLGKLPAMKRYEP